MLVFLPALRGFIQKLFSNEWVKCQWLYGVCFFRCTQRNQFVDFPFACSLSLLQYSNDAYLFCVLVWPKLFVLFPSICFSKQITITFHWCRQWKLLNFYLIQVHPCGQYRKNTVVGILQAEHGLAPLFRIHSPLIRLRPVFASTHSTLMVYYFTSTGFFYDHFIVPGYLRISTFSLTLSIFLQLFIV